MLLRTDEPIASRDGDLLGRAVFAEHVARLIQGATGQPSTVFGLIGPWGSGKSSLLNMIEEGLQGWSVQRFTPWSASTLDSLLQEFFATLAAGLPAEGPGERAKRRLLQCARIVSPALKAIPAAGEALAGVAGEALGRLDLPEPWAQRFQEAANEIEAIGMPMLIVVDDVDRLHADELVTMFKAVRLLGRFSGVHYLLAYDQETIVDVLCDTAIARKDRGRALAFLEKIVQYPLAIPPVQQYQLEGLLDEAIESLVAGASPVPFDQFRFSRAYERTLRPSLSTVRAMNRYVAQVETYWPLLGPAEVDLVDFLVLTHLRLHYPDLYGEMPRWRADLLGLEPALTPSSLTGRPPINWQQRIADSGVPQDEGEDVFAVLAVLFPMISEGGRPSARHYLLNRLSGSRRLGINDPDYFDRYFYFTVPGDDVSDAVMAEAVAEMARGESSGPARNRLADVLRGSDTRLAARAVEKCISGSEGIHGQAAISLAREIAALYVDAGSEGSVFGSTSDELTRWLAHVIPKCAQNRDEPEVDALLDRGAPATQLIRALQLITNERADYGALSAWRRRLADISRSLVFESLSLRDGAAIEPISAMLDLAVEELGVAVLAEAVADGLASGRWEALDVAARCVVLEASITHSGLSWQLGDFDRERFFLLMESSAEYLWDWEPLDADVNLVSSDTSWPNRKAFATHRLEPFRPEPQSDFVSV